MFIWRGDETFSLVCFFVQVAQISVLFIFSRLRLIRAAESGKTLTTPTSFILQMTLECLFAKEIWIYARNTEFILYESKWVPDEHLVGKTDEESMLYKHFND